MAHQGFAILGASSVEQLAVVVPDAEKDEYRRVHDHVENVVDLSCTGGGKIEFSSRCQKTSGSMAVCEEKDVQKYIATVLSPLRDEGDSDCLKFCETVERQAELVVISASEHSSVQELFQCEYGVAGGKRVLALFVVRSHKMKSTTGNTRYALMVSMFVDICTLTKGFHWNSGHISGLGKEQTLKWMKWKLLMKVENQRTEFNEIVGRALEEMKATRVLPPIELVFYPFRPDEHDRAIGRLKTEKSIPFERVATQPYNKLVAAKKDEVSHERGRLQQQFRMDDLKISGCFAGLE